MYDSFQKALLKLLFSPSLLDRVFAAEIKASPMHSDQSAIHQTRVKVIGTEPVQCKHQVTTAYRSVISIGV